MRVVQLLGLVVGIAAGVWATNFHELIRQEIDSQRDRSARRSIGPLDQALGREIPDFDMSSALVGGEIAPPPPRMPVASEVQGNPFLNPSSP